MKLQYSVLIMAFFLMPLTVADQADAERALAAMLTDAVREVNATTPQLIDEETRLDSAATFRNYIIYTNTMVNYSADQLDPALFKPIIQGTVIDTLCGNKQLVGFVDLKVVMVYRYLGKDGKFIAELSKDMGTCARS
ncbi:MAG: hypothetical protein AAF465_04275 [Pseudomonadota bacterium]